MTEFSRRSSCPACGDDGTTVIRTCAYTAPPISTYLERFYGRQGCMELEYLAGVDYVLRDCSACGLVFQEAAPVGAMATRLYERWIDPQKSFELYERDRRVEFFFPAVREIAEVIAFLGGRPRHLRLLDFGSGWGQWARFASGFGAEVICADIAASRQEVAHRDGLTVLCPDELPPQHFDFINCEQVFEHLPAPRETLRALRRALRPEGVILVSVPDGTDIRSRLARWDWEAAEGSRNWLMPVAPLEHVNCFSRPALFALGASAGLRPVEVPRRFELGPLSGPVHGTAAWLRRQAGRVKRRLTGRPGTRVFFTVAPD